MSKKLHFLTEYLVLFRIKSQETGQFFTVSLKPIIYVENKIFPYAVTPKRKAIS
jgi:hypothetical protein